jgi:DNA invertase Pin-like site-specific DNA recombinase
MIGVKHRVGRPNVRIQPEQVGQLKSQGVSWRRIGRALGIGTATAMRLFKSLDGARPNTQEARPKTPEQVE